MTRRRVPTLAFAALAAMLCGCATTTYSDHAGDTRVRGAFEQPFRDVSWMREEPPEVLTRVVEAPYSLESAECSAILNEISALDLVLGPDLDAPEVEDSDDEESSADATGLLSGAIRGVIGLPYRGVFRRLSGAERRDHVLEEAILAGLARRAFLKGVGRQAGCLESLPPQPQDQANATP